MQPQQSQNPPKPASDPFGINYSALELMNSTKGLLDGHKALIPLLVIGVILGVGLLLTKLSTIGFMLLFGVIFYIARLGAERNKKLWTKFASDNNWKVGPANLAENYVPPTLNNIGHSRVLSDIIEGQYSDNSFRVFTYKYTVGSGKNSTTYNYTIMQLVLRKQLPSFIVDSLRVSGVKNMPNEFEKISLEGDFDKTFSLYAPKGAQTDVLSVISPDVMQTLISSNTMQDVQCEGGFVWFMQSGDKRGKTLLPDLFKAVNSLADEFAHREKSYIVTNTNAHVTQAVTTGGVKPISLWATSNRTSRRITLTVVGVVMVIMVTIFITIAISAMQAFKSMPK